MRPLVCNLSKRCAGSFRELSFSLKPNPPIHSQVVSRAADKSRMRDFLFVAHVLSAPASLFLQLLFQTPRGQFDRSSLLSMSCRSPLKNELQRNYCEWNWFLRVFSGLLSFVITSNILHAYPEVIGLTINMAGSQGQ